MSQSIWFPFYIGDYLADTMQLSRDEHGGYDLLLFAYYKNQGPLPDDDKILARITKSTLSDWQAIRSAMEAFFQIHDGKWFHKRADFEIERAKLAQVARRKGAMQTNLKLGRTVSDTLIDTPSVVRATRSSVAIPQSQSQSQSEAESKVESEHKAFIALWTGEYLQHHKKPYVFQGGKDGNAVKTLLKSTKLSPQELITLAKSVWNCSFRMTQFLQTQSVTIAGFASKINEFQTQLTQLNGSVKKNQGHRLDWPT